MNHSQHNHCAHTSVAFCARCNVTYCKNCSKQWFTATAAVNIPSTWTSPEPTAPLSYPITSGGSITTLMYIATSDHTGH